MAAEPTFWLNMAHWTRMAYIAEGWRFCHNKSARKYRKAGHTVHYFAYGEYLWRAE